MFKSVEEIFFVLRVLEEVFLYSDQSKKVSVFRSVEEALLCSGQSEKCFCV